LSKAEALRFRIRRDIPTVNVRAVPKSVQDALGSDKQLLDRVDLVVVTTADWSSEFALWELKAAGTDWSLLQAWSEPHSMVGHALLAPAGAFDARGLFEDSGEFRHAYSRWPDDGVIKLPACGESYVPGGPIDLAAVSAMVSSLAVQSLAGPALAPSWWTSIKNPSSIQALGGTYLGPSLPIGSHMLQVERPWP
jgi:hypothetical protein